MAIDSKSYNPLNHIVVCPYVIVGCNHTCKRVDLPLHLSTCVMRQSSEKIHDGVVEYEVVCPYTVLGERRG